LAQQRAEVAVASEIDGRETRLSATVGAGRLLLNHVLSDSYVDVALV